MTILRRVLQALAPSQKQVSNSFLGAQDPFEVLRKKWGEVPTARAGRRKTADLIKLSDADLIQTWQASHVEGGTGSQYSHQGWYRTLYLPGMKDKKILDVGSGLALDTILFAQNGASVTFVDLVDSNLNVLKRLCKLFDLNNVDFLLLEDLDSLENLDDDYDFIMAMGSLHHAPQEVIRPEAKELLKHLKPGGRWLQLAYPKTRWVREGSLPFSEWGHATDGEGTPWAEWYDLPKLLDLLSPARFEVVLCQEFHDHAFIWFDLLYLGPVEEKPIEAIS